VQHALNFDSERGICLISSTEDLLIEKVKSRLKYNSRLKQQCSGMITKVLLHTHGLTNPNCVVLPKEEAHVYPCHEAGSHNDFPNMATIAGEIWPITLFC